MSLSTHNFRQIGSVQQLVLVAAGLLALNYEHSARERRGRPTGLSHSGNFPNIHDGEGTQRCRAAAATDSAR